MLNVDYADIPPIRPMDICGLSVALMSNSPKEAEADRTWLSGCFDNVTGATIETFFLYPSPELSAVFRERLLLFCGEQQFDLVVIGSAHFADHPLFHAMLMMAATMSKGKIVFPMVLASINDMSLAGLPWNSSVFRNARIQQYLGLDSCLVEFDSLSVPPVKFLDWYLKEGHSLSRDDHRLVMDAIYGCAYLDRALHALVSTESKEGVRLICESALVLLSCLGLESEYRPKALVEADVAISQKLHNSLQAAGYLWEEISFDHKRTNGFQLRLSTADKHPIDLEDFSLTLDSEKRGFRVEPPCSVVKSNEKQQSCLYEPGLDLSEDAAARLFEVERVQRAGIDVLNKHFEDPQQLYAALRPFSGHWRQGWKKLIQWLRDHGYSFAHQHRIKPGSNGKVVCIRYDVHVRDIVGAWGMLGLNEELGVKAEYHLFWGHGLHETMQADSFSALAAHESPLAAFGLHTSLLDHHLMWQFFDGDEGVYARALDGPQRDEFISLLSDPDQLQLLEKSAKKRFSRLHATFEKECAPCRCYSFHGSYINWLLREGHWKDSRLNKLVLSLQGERLIQEALAEYGNGQESDYATRVLGFEYVSDNLLSESTMLNRLCDAVTNGFSILLLVHPALLQRGQTSFVALPMHV